MIEIAQYRALTATPAAPETVTKPAAKVARAPRTTKAPPKPVKLSALDFWALHGQAVDKIRAEYSDNWKLTAPIGETCLTSIEARLRPSYSVGGKNATIVRWPRDSRMPAAKYWPGKAFPVGVIDHGDYERADPVEAAKIRHHRAQRTGKAPTATPHSDDWHRAHGYVWNGKDWVSSIGLSRSQPFADIADDLAEAAD